MRTYIPDYLDVGISQERYRELLHHCRQYREWKAEASSLIGVGAQQYSVMPHGSDPGDPVGRAVIRRELLLAKCASIERIADAIDGGQWRAALLQNICLGIPLYCIDPVIMPTSRRNDYFKRKRDFFVLLNAELNKRDTLGALNT